VLRDIVNQLNIQFARAQAVYNEISLWTNWESTIFNDFEKIKTIDSFIFRFIKIQDQMGNRLFRYFLDELGDYDDSMSLIDILDKLEKIGIVNESADWMLNRKLRNILTHEYPDNEMEILDGIRLALGAYVDMVTIYKRIIDYCEKRTLI
jgi:hypothetical protein